jgi:hypothetical protein
MPPSPPPLPKKAAPALPVKRLCITLCATLGIVVASMLIWRKLRIVTGVPRTAYAEPDRHASTPDEHPPAR